MNTKTNSLYFLKRSFASFLNVELCFFKQLFCLLLFCGSICELQAQARIYGNVVDGVGKPLPNANVLLLNSRDSVLIKGVLTGGEGTYAFENVRAGTYLVSYTYSGLTNAYSSLLNVSTPHETLNLGSQVLMDSARELTDVTVLAKKPLYEQRIDRMIINVAASSINAGSTALDVLERSPGIIVDRQNGSISINGKGGVIVMINGKRNYMELSALVQLLSGMPSGNIERIEIITTPPANFDAEGNAGIINIILKRNEQYGTNGSYSIAQGYNKGLQNQGSLNLNHRNKKINLFGNYSYDRSPAKQLWTNYHAVTFAGSFIENYSESNRDALSFQHDGQIGMDYQVHKKTVAGVLFTGSYRHWGMEANNYALVSKERRVDTSVQIVNNEIHNTSNYGININLQHDFRADQKLSVNLDYLKYNDYNPNTYDNAYYDVGHQFAFAEQVRSNKTTPLRFWIAAMDYSKKLSKKLSLEAGLKNAISRLQNDVAVEYLVQNEWLTDTSLSGMHHLRERISAAYASLNMTLTEKTSLKLGLRYENTASNLGSLVQENIVDRHYGNLFSSFFILHTLNENSTVNFSYSRRIWRPSFTALAPWVIFYDPKTFQTGNPALQPSITDAISAAYAFKGKTLSLSYSYVAHPTVLQPKVIESSNKLISFISNGETYQNVSASLSLPLKLTKWWNMQNNLSGYWTRSVVFYKAKVQTSNTAFYVNSTQTFTLLKELSMQVSAYYYSGDNFGLYRYSAAGSLDYGIQKKLVKHKSMLSFNIRNILNSLTGTYSAFIPEQNLYQKNKSTYGYRNYSLTFTHNFGSEKVKEKRSHATGAEEEQGRAN